MDERKMIEFTPEKLEKFKKIYDNAVEKKLEVFYYQGDEWLTSYAKYAIEYLTDKFSKNEE